MKDVEIIGMLKSFVKATLVGMGALKGAPCQCVITTNADGTHKVTMMWVDNEGDSHTGSFNVLNGQVGDLKDLGDVTLAGLQEGQTLSWDAVKQKWVNAQNSATVNTLNAIGDVTITSVQDGEVLVWDDTASKWVNKALTASDISGLANVAKSGDYNDLTNKPSIPAAQIQSDWSQSDNTKADYIKNKPSIPAAQVQSDWSQSDNTKADFIKGKPTTLSGYGITNAYTKTETDNAITAEIEKLDVSDSATAGSYVTAVSEANGKISVTRETADVTPTANSGKMLTSGGAKTALDAKQDTLTFDNAPTENSNNPVKSGGVYSADANIYAEMTRQGVKNILSQQFDEVMITASLGNKATSANGLTLTYNSDGSIKIDGIPTDSSKNVAIRFDWDSNNHPFDISYLAGKKIVASILETEINGIKIIPGYFDASNGAHQYSGTDITTKGEYTYGNDAKWARCYMSISGAYSYSEVTVYPMIYIPFEGATDDYAPPTKTNQELTAEQGEITDEQYAAIQALLT